GVCTGTPYTCGAALCQAGGACLGDGGCNTMQAADWTPCGDGGFCGMGMCKTYFPYAPSNVALSQVPPSGAVNIDCTATFDSKDGGGSWCHAAPAVYFVTQAGSTEPAVVLSMTSLAITGQHSLRITGSRPVIMLVWDTGPTTLDGTINASSTGPGIVGPGGNRDSCGLQTGGAGSKNNSRGGGGGGGGFNTRGGWGGQGDNGNAPGGDGGTVGPAMLSPLVGGCAGGQGGQGTSSAAGAPGGAGGGALQISVAGELKFTMNSVVSVSGGGGAGGLTTVNFGGGGGGSGGGLLLEGNKLTLATGWVTSNGGGGGGGADNSSLGKAGDDGTLASSSAALGGNGGTTYAGTRGAGGAAAAPGDGHTNN